MDELEKVIKGLRCCKPTFFEAAQCHQICPYDKYGHDKGGCVDQLISDALQLLKAQEPQKAKHIISTAVSAMGDCPSCGAKLSTGFLPYQVYTKFCYNCGQAVKWNG